MTKISNLYSLTNYITANSSGNVVIAAPTSGFTLDVTGNFRATAGYFTGGIVSIDNLSSTLIINRTATTSGGASVGFATDSIYQWVLGLKSNVNENLYLYNPTGIDYVIFNATTGGATFNYPLAGTSATFSSSVTAGGDFASILASNSATNLFRGTFLTGNSATAAGKVRFGGGESGQLRAYMEAIQSWNGSFTDSILNFVTTRGGVGGDIRMTINGLGNVGIGTTSPASVLEVAGTSVNTDFRISRTVSPSTYFYIKAPGGSPSASNIGINGTDVMTLNASGNVGIGTTAPTERLDINSTMNLNGVGGCYASIQYNASTRGYWGTANAVIASGANNDFGISATSNLVFGTGGSYTERMRITSGGLVGINVTPSGGDGMLQITSYAGVLGDSSKRRSLVVSSTTAENADQPGVILGYDTGGAGIVAARTNSTGQPLAFWTYNGSSWGERMRITSAGNFDYGGYNVQHSNNSIYRQAFYGALSIMWRNAEDAYLNSNTTYSSSNTDIATYTSSNGIGRATIGGGTLEWASYNGSVTAGSSYSLTKRFSIGKQGYVEINSVETALRINTGSGQNALSIAGTGAISVDYPGVGGGRFSVSDNGNVGMPRTYGFTTSNAANLFIDSSGLLYRSTSSLKYKTNVRDYNKGLDILSQMRPVYYEGIGASDSGKVFAGLIAEEIHDLGLTEFVQYAEDGTPDALAYQNMIALLTKAIQELSAKVTALENK